MLLEVLQNPTYLLSEAAVTNPSSLKHGLCHRGHDPRRVGIAIRPCRMGLFGVDQAALVLEIVGMSTAVLEITEAIAEKARKLTRDEWHELMEALEDMEDLEAAKQAKIRGGKRTSLEDLEKELGLV